MLLIATVFIQNIKAQNTFNIQEINRSVYSRFGIEPTYHLALGFRQSFPIKKIKRNAVLYGELSSPVKGIGGSNYEVKTGGILNVLKLNSFGISYHLNFSTGHVKTKNFDSQKFAFSNKLLAGYFSDKWYLAFSGEYEKVMSNKIIHTQYYRDYIFPEAKDGWYKSAGGNIQLGIEVGTTIKGIIDIGFDLKVPKSERFNSYNGSPANANLSTAYRF